MLKKHQMSFESPFYTSIERVKNTFVSGYRVAEPIVIPKVLDSYV